MADKKPRKRYEIRNVDKVLRRTDDLEAAEKKMNQLRAENAPYFRLTDNVTGEHITYKKETYQKNYLRTVVPGNKQ